MPEKRIQFYDFLRGAAILAVIVQHVAAPALHEDLLGASWWFAACIVGVCKPAVPVFLMVSGALLLARTTGPEPANWLRFFRRRLLRVLVPFLAWATAYYVVGCLTAGDPVFAPRQYVAEIMRGFGTEHIPTHLWFMPVIIAMYLLTPVLAVFMRHATPSEKGLFIGLCLVFGILVPMARELFAITASPSGYIYATPVLYFGLGYLLRERRPGRPGPWGGLCGAAAAASIVGTAFFTHRADRFSNLLFHHSSAAVLLMSTALFLLARRAHDTGGPPWFLRLPARLGPLAFGMYLVHAFWLQLGRRLMPDTSPWMVIPVLSVGVTAASIASIAALRRLPLMRRLVP